MEYFGIDLHSKHSTLFGFDDVGEVTCEERVPATQHGLEGVFGGRDLSPRRKRLWLAWIPGKQYSCRREIQR